MVDGKVHWGNLLVNASRAQAAKRKREALEREKESRRKAREVEQARRQEEKDRLRKEKERARLIAKTERENITREKKEAAEQKKILAAMKKQQLINQRETARKEKKLLRLNGLFLEFNLPISYQGIDLREFALEYETKNGLTRASQFKAVTAPYIKENLPQLIKDKLISTNLEKLEALTNEYIENTFLARTNDDRNYLRERNKPSYDESLQSEIIQPFLELYTNKHPINYNLTYQDIVNNLAAEPGPVMPNEFIANEKEVIDTFVKLQIVKINEAIHQLKTEEEVDVIKTNLYEIAKGIELSITEWQGINKRLSAWILQVTNYKKGRFFNRGKYDKDAEEYLTLMLKDLNTPLQNFLNLRKIIISFKDQNSYSGIQKEIILLKTHLPDEIMPLETMYKEHYKNLYVEIENAFLNIKALVFETKSSGEQERFLSLLKKNVLKDYSESKHIVKLVEIFNFRA